MAKTLKRELIEPPYKLVRPTAITEESEFKNEILILVSAPLLDKELQPIISLSVQHEINGILEAVQDSGIGLEIVVKIANAETLNNEIFSDQRSPLVIHFIGHGVIGADGVALVLEDDVGMAHPFFKRDFRALLSNLRRPPCQVAFLNACHSDGMAEEFLRADVEHVIAINASDRILDAASRCFAKSFYSVLLKNNTVQESFDRGVVAVKIDYQLAKIVDFLTHKRPNFSEALKFHLLPGNSDVHQRKLAFQSYTSGQVVTPKWEKTNLSSEDQYFIGRNLEIHQVAKIILENRNNCVSLHGMGGIGKTVLAQAIGRWQHERHRWYDGVWFVELRNIRTVDAARDRVMSIISELITPEKRKATYSNSDLKVILSNKNLLLILDDLDSLLTSNSDISGLVDFINALINNRKNCLIITSRKNLPSNILRELKEIQSTSRNVAEHIFFLYSTNKEQIIDLDSHSDLESLLDKLDGYPLAIKIVATFMKESRCCSLRDLRVRLEEEFVQVLNGSKKYDTTRDYSLIASLNLSYKNLPPATRNMFSHLALFPGGLTVDIARYVFNKGAEEALETLLLFSMAEKTQSATWRLPEPARKYALEKSPESESEMMDLYAVKVLEYFYELLKNLDDFSIKNMINNHQINLKYFLGWGYRYELGTNWVCYSARIILLLSNYWQLLAPGEDLSSDVDLALSAASRCNDKEAQANLNKIKSDNKLPSMTIKKNSESDSYKINNQQKRRKFFPEEYNEYFDQWDSFDSEQQLNVTYLLLKTIKIKHGQRKKQLESYKSDTFSCGLVWLFGIGSLFYILIHANEALEIIQSFLISNKLLVLNKQIEVVKMGKDVFVNIRFFIALIYSFVAYILSWIAHKTIIFLFELRRFSEVRKLNSMKKTARIFFNLLRSSQRSLARQEIGILDKSSDDEEVYSLPEEYKFLEIID